MPSNEGWWILGVAVLFAVVWVVFLMGREFEHADLMERAEVRWWCRVDNEFGPAGEAHPYCYPRHMTGNREHLRCGWGLWTPRHTRHGVPL